MLLIICFNAFRVIKRKLRCLSLPGCAINDEILMILAPALITVSRSMKITIKSNITTKIELPS